MAKLTPKVTPTERRRVKEEYLQQFGYPMGNPTEKWTVKQIQTWLTDHYRDSIIPRVAWYKTNENPDPVMDKLITKLQKSATGRTYEDGTMYLGLHKNKKDLLKQTRRVRELEQYDRKTPTAVAFKEDKYERAYQTYTERYGYLSREQYDELVNMYGHARSLLEDFGYGDKYNVGSDRLSKDSLTQYIHDQYTMGFTPGQIRWAMSKAKKKLEKAKGDKSVIIDARTSLDALQSVFDTMRPKSQPIGTPDYL